MSENLPHILPSLPPQVEEGFAAYQTTKQFYHEVQTRVEFQRYCEWYSITAEQHRQELKKMRSEVNILRWFRR
ncbi:MULTISPECIES: hypothetical protein [unclassified Anabaena]|uniref:hypothetical protein n=1 Tax=unclassified Anabaena TaxID=2619674 RepID=UPI00168792BF|nr:hypothetical protein [Anabaena sp. UHCC 0399]MBD2362329.1 hypothetical protein [Anabaena minutissima FACHB-250]MEA5564817.1 hypothetical protein [Anabaena sp. UHCC 0399]